MKLPISCTYFVYRLFVNEIAWILKGTYLPLLIQRGVILSTTYITWISSLLAFRWIARSWFANLLGKCIKYRRCALCLYYLTVAHLLLCKILRKRDHHRTSNDLTLNRWLAIFFSITLTLDKSMCWYECISFSFLIW